eukprot:3780573-Karenia_brevis.AAC.1
MDWQAGLAGANGWAWQTGKLDPSQQAQSQVGPQVCANNRKGGSSPGQCQHEPTAIHRHDDDPQLTHLTTNPPRGQQWFHIGNREDEDFKPDALSR